MTERKQRAIYDSLEDLFGREACVFFCNTCGMDIVDETMEQALYDEGYFEDGYFDRFL